MTVLLNIFSSLGKRNDPEKAKENLATSLLKSRQLDCLYLYKKLFMCEMFYWAK